MKLYFSSDLCYIKHEEGECNMARKYIKRLFDDVLDFAIQSKGAVVIVGPKWCGKSTTAARYARSVIDLMPLDTRDDYIKLAKVSPSEFLNLGEKPILIDEWQHVSFIWDQIKYEVDKTGDFGQYILTGSVSDKEKNDLFYTGSRHTGNGRITKKMMRTMSLYESGESNGKVSLLDLKNGIFNPCFSEKTIYDYGFYICRGGWPLSLNVKEEIALAQATEYYEMVVTEDIFSLQEIPLKHDEQRARKVMRSYSRNISIAATDETLRKDCIGNDEIFDKDTFAKYLQALRNLYVIEELPAWNPNLRSKTAIRSGFKRSFVDPSIAVATLGLSPDALLTQLKTFGFIFEQMCIRDLKSYNPDFNSHISYYRDRYGLEADLVLHLSDGRYALIECKLGSKEIETGAEHLNELRTLIKEYNKTEKQVPLREPDLMIILTGGKMAYTRPDGVKIIPLACLKD